MKPMKQKKCVYGENVGHGLFYKDMLFVERNGSYWEKFQDFKWQSFFKQSLLTALSFTIGCLLFIPKTKRWKTQRT